MKTQTIKMVLTTNPSVSLVKSEENGNRGKAQVQFVGTVDGTMSPELTKELSTSDYLSNGVLRIRKYSDSVEQNTEFVDMLTKDCVVGTHVTWIYAPKGYEINGRKTESGFFHSPAISNKYDKASRELLMKLQVLAEARDKLNIDINPDKVVSINA